MELLPALKFVQGAVARKEIQEGLTHFRINEGFVRGYNGVISLCSPIDINIDCTPKAEPMLKAIAACESSVQMTVLTNGKLSIKSGGFKVAVPCLTGETMHVEPEGEFYDINGDVFLSGLKMVQPFISNDASRPWSCGVLIKGGCMYATNNASIVQYWFGAKFPVDVAVPRMAIKELLRIKDSPVRVQVANKSITFHYSNGCWLRSQLLDLSWPNMDSIIDKGAVNENPYTFPQSVFEALEKIKPFCEADGKIYVESGLCRTHYDENEGACAAFNDVQTIGIYNIELLLQLKGLATSWDASRYTTPDDRGLPPPIIFYGDNMRGLIAGFRS